MNKPILETWAEQQLPLRSSSVKNFVDQICVTSGIVDGRNVEYLQGMETIIMNSLLEYIKKVNLAYTSLKIDAQTYESSSKELISSYNNLYHVFLRTGAIYESAYSDRLRSEISVFNRSSSAVPKDDKSSQTD